MADSSCSHFLPIHTRDFSRARCRQIEMGDVDESSADEEDSPHSSQLFNPPYVNALSFSPGGRYLAVSRGDGEVGIYDYASSKRVAALRGGHSTAVAHSCFLDDGGGRRTDEGGLVLASVGNDRALCLW